MMLARLCRVFVHACRAIGCLPFARPGLCCGRVCDFVQRLKLQPGRRFTLPPQIYPVCALCGLPAKCICALCFEALYCSRACQIKAWPDHVSQCNLVQVGGAVGPIAIAERAALMASAHSNAGAAPSTVTSAGTCIKPDIGPGPGMAGMVDAQRAPHTKRSEMLKSMSPDTLNDAPKPVKTGADALASANKCTLVSPREAQIATPANQQ